MLTSVPPHRHHLPLIDETALSDQHPLAGDGNVIATAFFTDELAAAVAALGHSLARVNTTARRIAIYVPEQVSPRGLCIARRDRGGARYVLARTSQRLSLDIAV